MHRGEGGTERQEAESHGVHRGFKEVNEEVPIVSRRRDLQRSCRGAGVHPACLDGNAECQGVSEGRWTLPVYPG
eukprot:3857347-Pyramimonas_sp.AAC.1